jgi:hypothetical protein
VSLCSVSLPERGAPTAVVPPGRDFRLRRRLRRDKMASQVGAIQNSTACGKIKAVPWTKSPLTPLYERGEFVETTLKSSPFGKGGSRGILLRLRLPENHRSISTLQANLNYTTSTAEVFASSKAMFFTSIFCGSLFCGSAVHNPRVCPPLSTIGISFPIV